MYRQAAKSLFLLLVTALVLHGCSTAELAIDLLKKPAQKQAKEAAKDAVAAPVYKIGDPYNIAGIWYYPERDLTYDETGIGSWYGDEFAGRLTANGEIFDPAKVTAAHKTLPMPSVVRVTNLDNGKSLVVRVNDRGPFVSGRIIDLSREAARLIGYQKAGIARVRVQVLAEQSLRLETLARKGDFSDIDGSGQIVMPEVNAAAKPSVNLTAKSNTAASKFAATKSQSALDLLSQSRVGEVISVAPVETQIWVQVGAFHAETSATAVLKKVGGIGTGEVSSVNRLGKTLYRVRLGPVADVDAADSLLDKVVNIGFGGARIVVD
jgi:rare lipoprotein A